MAKVKRTSSGKVDKRTKEGKAICARMAKARRAAAKKRKLKSKSKAKADAVSLWLFAAMLS